MTLTQQQVPSAYQERLILSSYRLPGLTFTQSIRSIFQWHNETFNFWTHFVVFGYFFWKFYNLGFPFVDDPHYWPLLCAGIGSCMYPLLSSFAHALCSMGIKTRHTVFYLDYLGISLFMCGSSISFLAYTSPDDTSDFTTYFFCITTACLSILSCLASCKSRHVSRQYGNILRLAAFSLPYFFTTGYILYWLYLESSPLHFHYPHIFWNPMIALVNVCRLPERYVPFHFDVLGHSHQIFHMVAFIATNHQINAMVEDCLLQKHSIALASQLSIQMMVLVLVADIVIVIYHALQLYLNDQKKDN